MEQNPPLHTDKHRSTFNLTLIFSVIVALVGLWQGAPELLVVGLAFGAFAWLTTPSQYLIFPDRLEIAYGRPRVRSVFFGQIDHVDERVVFGGRLMVRLRNGRPLLIQPRDLDEFRTRIEGALDSYRRDNGEETGEVPEQES
jgi:hypothetical protein